MSRDILVGTKLSNAVSLAASFNTAWVPVTHMCLVGFTIETASVVTNAGTFIPQIRIKKDDNNYSGPIDLDLSVPIVLANANIATFVNLNQLPPVEVRMKYTKSSGTVDGTVTIWVSGAGL